MKCWGIMKKQFLTYERGLDIRKEWGVKTTHGSITTQHLGVCLSCMTGWYKKEGKTL